MHRFIMGINSPSGAPTGEGPVPSVREVFDAHHVSLYRFAYSLCGQEADAKDLVQETFLRYARSGSALRDPSKARTWLFTTLRRLFLRQARHAQREPSHEEEVLDREAPAQTPDLARGMDAQRALAVLAEVDERYRVPLSLFYLKDLPYQEIAAILGVPLGTVMSRIARGKAQLAKIYHEADPPDSRAHSS